MRHHRELFENVKKRTGMYFQQESYAVVAAFVMGYDEAYEGGLLAGFREWLVLRVGRGENLGWVALVLTAAFPDAAEPEQEVERSAAAQRHAIDTLFALLAQYDQVRTSPDGLKKTLIEYARFEEEDAR
jgi:hypothetical protein